MKNIIGLGLVLLFLLVGCATTPKKIVVWETESVARPYKVLGPVSVREEVAETNEEMISGIAGFISRDGRVSDQIPADLRDALEAKRLKYRDIIFEKLASKAQEYGADAVIKANYRYLPPYVSFSKKAVVTAEGEMVEY